MASNSLKDESADPLRQVTDVVKKRLRDSALFEVLFLVPAPVLYFCQSSDQIVPFITFIGATLALRAVLFKRGTPRHYAFALAIASVVLVLSCCGAAAATLSQCDLSIENVTVTHYKGDDPRYLNTTKTDLTCLRFVSSFRRNVMRPCLRHFGVEHGPHGISFASLYEIPCQTGMLYLMHKLFMDCHKMPFLNSRLPNAAVLFLDFADIVQLLMAFFNHDAYLLFHAKTWTTLPMLGFVAQIPFSWLLLSWILFLWIVCVLQACLEFYISLQDNLDNAAIDLRKQHTKPINTFNLVRSLVLNLTFLMARVTLRFKAGYFSPMFSIKNVFFTVIGVYFPCCASKKETGDSLNKFFLEFLPGGSKIKKEQFTVLLKEFLDLKDEIVEKVKAFEYEMQGQNNNEVATNHIEYMKKKVVWLTEMDEKFDPDKLQAKAIEDIGFIAHMPS